MRDFAARKDEETKILVVVEARNTESQLRKIFER